MPFNFDASSVRKLFQHEQEMLLDDLESVEVKPEKIEDEKGGHWFVSGTIQAGQETANLEIVSLPGKLFISSPEDLQVLNPKNAVLSNALFDQIQRTLNEKASS